MNNSIELFVEHFSLYTKRKMTDTTLRLRSTSHTQSYFYIKYRKHIKNFKSNVNSSGKKYLYSK